MRAIRNLMTIGALSAIAVFAQGPGGAMTSGLAPDPATMVDRHVQQLTAILGLSADQAAQAKTIFLASTNAVAPLETALRTHRESLRTAVKENSTATIDRLANEIGSLTGQITAIQNKADAAFYAILTADQKNKLDQRRGIWGMGGPGGMGPGGGRGRMGAPRR